jgi:putative lipoprotein
METRFFEALTAVVGFRQQDTQLQLKGADGETLLRFEAQEAPLR